MLGLRWLVPIEDRRKHGELREGMREGFTLGQYLMLVDYTSRIVRDGKAAVSAELESILTRLGSSNASWQSRLLKLSGPRLIGRFVAASRDRLLEVAQRIGVRHLANVGYCRSPKRLSLASICGSATTPLAP